MHDLTAANTGKRLAIVWDGEVLIAPMVLEPFGAEFAITGKFEREELETIAIALKNGPLPVPLRLVSERTTEN